MGATTGLSEGADATIAHKIWPYETICHSLQVPQRLLPEAVWGKAQSQCLRQTTDKEDPGAQGIPQEAN